MYSPGTDWTATFPYPAFITASRVYIQPTVNHALGDFTPVRAWCVSASSTGVSSYVVKKQGGGLAAVAYTSSGFATVAELDVEVQQTARISVHNGLILIADGSGLRMIALSGASYTKVPLRVSDKIFLDGFASGPFAMSEFTGLGGSFYSEPLVQGGNILCASFPASASGAYMKLTDWTDATAAESGRIASADGSTLSFLLRISTSDAVWYVPNAGNGLYRERQEGKTGLGFFEVDDTTGKDVYRTADGAEFLPRKSMYSAVVTGPSHIDRWLRFDPNDRLALVVKKGTVVNGTVSGHEVFYEFPEDTSLHIGTTLLAGAEYYAVLGYDGSAFSLTAKTAAQLDGSEVIVGRFSTMCADCGTMPMTTWVAKGSATANGTYIMVKPYRADADPDFYAHYRKLVRQVITTYSDNSTANANYDTVVVDHPLSGWKAGEIIPESVWCADFFPASLVDDAMVFDCDTGRAVDIYLQSGTGQNTRSAYVNNQTTRRRTPLLHSMDMASVGKNLLTDHEFTCAAKGSNEMTNISGGMFHAETGGHVDTAGRRMVSAIGCEDMCGHLWQWLDELGPVGDNTSGWTTDADPAARFGQSYGLPQVLHAGGRWNDGAHCGSVARDAGNLRSNVHTHDGARGSSRVVHGARCAA
jgi:hypothetical protein